MRKIAFSSTMKTLAFALMATVATSTMFSCGNDDSDNSTGSNGSSGGIIPTSFTLIEPCLQWGSSVNQVKSYMADNSTYSLSTSSNGVLSYSAYGGSYLITYMCTDRGLRLVETIQSMSGNLDNTSIINVIQTKYNVSLENLSDTAETEQTSIGYHGYANIGGENCPLYVVIEHLSSPAETTNVTVVYNIGL